jgi:hypothetical protein
MPRSTIVGNRRGISVACQRMWLRRLWAIVWACAHTGRHSERTIRAPFNDARTLAPPPERHSMPVAWRIRCTRHASYVRLWVTGVESPWRARGCGCDDCGRLCGRAHNQGAIACKQSGRHRERTIRAPSRAPTQGAIACKQSGRHCVQTIRAP